MRKIGITLKIVQIEEKSYFLALFLSGKGKTVWKHDHIMYSGAGQLLYTSFASKLLLKEVICKKNRQKRFQQNQVHIAIFASERLVL